MKMTMNDMTSHQRCHPQPKSLYGYLWNSLYPITGLKSLHSTETVTEEQLRDTAFIYRDQIRLRDAEQLATYFLDPLNPYSFQHDCGVQGLERF